MKRRDFLWMMTTGITPVLSGCFPLTEKLLKDSPRTMERHTYTETVSAFLITSDGKKLVVLGNGYHYIFNAPPNLIQALQASFHPLISASLSGFTVENNEVSGRYELSLDPKAGDEQKAAARKIGFEPDTDGSLVLRDTLTGTRYSAKDFNPAAIKNKFNKTYRVEVSEWSATGGGPGAKILLTPVTLAGDGVLILIGTAVLIPLLLTICIASKGKCSAGG
jgi:hypothetical protein